MANDIYTLNELQNRERALRNLIFTVTERVEKFVQQRSAAEAAGNTAEAARLDALISDNRNFLAVKQDELQETVAEIQQRKVNEAAAGPTSTAASSGDIVAQSQQARDSGASATSPPTGALVATDSGDVVPAPPITTPTTATPVETQQNNPQQGTDGTYRPGTETQAVPVTTGAQSSSVENSDTPRAATADPGAVAGPDDSGTTSLNRVTVTGRKKRPTKQSYIYQIKEVISSFKGGSFTQVLKGPLYTLDTALIGQPRAVSQDRDGTQSLAPRLPQRGANGGIVGGTRVTTPPLNTNPSTYGTAPGIPEGRVQNSGE